MHRFLLFIIFWIGSVQAYAVVLPIPNAGHAAFLLEPWKASAPVVLVFTDPFCPYCIQALKRKSELKPYNAYLFWYPIFGERSDKRVEEIFQCDSPVSAQVIDAVIARKSPGCNSQNKELAKLNREMYEAYSPSGVPSYYFGGVKVSLAELKAWRAEVKNVIPSVVIDWSRYAENRLDISSNSLSKVIIVLPIEYKKNINYISRLKENRSHDWYIFESGGLNGYSGICQDLVGKCKAKSIKNYVYSTKEIMLLYDLTIIEKPVIIMNGKVLSAEEKAKYFSFMLDTI